jgi:hypothetical protein
VIVLLKQGAVFMSANNIISFPTLNQPEAWDPPILFEEHHTPEILAHWLPGIFSEFAAALAQATETPEALSVMTILGVLSAVLMQRVVISPKPTWFEPINIYTLIALPPANHKSFILNSCTQPLLDWEEAQRQQLSTEIKRKRSERKNQEKKIEALRTKAAKAKSELEQMQLAEQATQLEMNLTDIPITPILFINDATPESLAAAVQEQGGKLGIFSDEGGILETLAGLYSHGTANIDVLLKGIDGGAVRVRRKDRSMSLNPYLTVMLAVQPTVIHRLAEKTAFAGNGALERFLYVIPQSRLGYRSHNTPPVPASVQHAYHQQITTLLQQFAVADSTKSTATKTVLTLTDPAVAVWKSYQAEMETQLRPEGKFSCCLGWAGKMPGFALRLAGLLHIAEYGAAPLLLSEATMQNALALARALGDHALAAFGLMGADSAHEDAQFIFRWMISLSKATFTQSELTIACRHKKWTTERVDKALRVLQARHLISAPVRQPGRFKPTTLYFVHPSLVSIVNGK